MTLTASASPRGDTRGAFATMVKHAGFAPRALAAMPLAAVRLVLRAGIRGREWQRTEALLGANLAEQQAQLDAAGIPGYAEIESQTLLIGGSASPPSVAAQLQALRRTIPTTTVTTFDGLDHPAPVTHPAQVANCVEQFFAHTPCEGAAMPPTLLDAGQITQRYAAKPSSTHRRRNDPKNSTSPDSPPTKSRTPRSEPSSSLAPAQPTSTRKGFAKLEIVPASDLASVQLGDPPPSEPNRPPHRNPSPQPPFTDYELRP